jgi:hypothetical protein
MNSRPRARRRANGGEPLWTVPKNPAIFVSARGSPQISLSGRLPRTFQRVLGLSHVERMKKIPTGTLGKTTRAVASGSRLLNTLFGLPRSGRNSARSLGHDRKRLPSIHPYAQDTTNRYLPSQHGLALVLRSFSEGGSEAALNGFRELIPIEFFRHCETGRSRVLS